MRTDAIAARLRASLPTVLIIGLAACAAPVAPSSTPEPAPPSTMPSATAVDLSWLVDELERSHPEPFHAVSRDEFVAALDRLEARLPEMAAEEALVEMMGTWALLSPERDGHQFALPQIATEGPLLPLRIYEFAEGVFVTQAMPPHEDLVGSRIVAIEGRPMAEVLASVEPLVPRDGPQTVPAHRPILLLQADVLRGLGIIGDGDVVEIELEDLDGASRTVELTLASAPDHADFAGEFGRHRLPLDPRMTYLATEDSTSELLEGGIAYLRYRFVGPTRTGDVREWIDAGQVRRLVLDLRQNPGGDNGTYGELLTLVEEWAEAHPGTLTVLTDRVTFSAASNLATEIEQATDARFVGEPMGGAPNFWDDVRWVDVDDLPIPMRLAISTIAWQFAPADDPRLTIEPDISVEVTAADHFVGRDPALEAALSE